LTLIQTKRIKSFPVILMGSEYWKGLLDWLKDTMLGQGMISLKDMELFRVLDEPEEIVDYIRKFVIV
ncbi:MAG TPA: LOG family protein, partial [Syntrophales bacterium]|nr:LOG family protein [Syntrophales bacterium]